MKKTLLLLMCISIAFSMVIPDKQVFAEEPVIFEDVKGHWAEADIQEAVRRNIIAGFPDGTFRPDNIVTADQLLVMLFRAYAKTYTTSKGDQVRWDQEFLQHLNLVYPGALGALQNALATNPFDFQASTTEYWAKPFVDFAYDMGYLATFDPVYPKNYDRFQEPVSREQASYLLGIWLKGYENTFDRTYENFALNTGIIKDLHDFSRSNVSGYVASMLLSGVIRGYPGGYFYPHRYVTRAEAVSMIMRVRDPERRLPFKPDLSQVCFSQTNDYNIHIFDDQVKCEAYQTILDLANSTVKDGYIEVGTLGVAIFADKDEADTNTRYWQLGLFDEIPSGEMSFTVGDEGERFILLVYSADDSLTYSKPFFDAAIRFMAGEDHEQSLRDAWATYLKASEGLDASTIDIGGRNFRLSRTMNSYVIKYIY